MKGVAHVVARAGADDPHTLAVLALAEAMPERTTRRNGDRVFAVDGAAGIEGVKPLGRRELDGADLVVYHHAEAAPALARRLAELGARVAVVHGAAPASPLGARDLRLLGAAGARGLATSDAGAEALTAAGFAAVHRAPPVVARERLAAVPAFEPTAHHLAVALSGPLVVSVGELASADPTARVVQAYHVLRTYLRRAGHLALAVPRSPETDETAVLRVNRELWGLRLADAWVQRLAHPGERAALIRGASVFVTTDPACGDTRHALAAMAEGVAVVAIADTSSAEILGDGVLRLPADAPVALVAEAVAELLGDDARRGGFAAAAARAVARFDPAVVAPAWREALAS